MSTFPPDRPAKHHGRTPAATSRGKPSALLTAEDVAEYIGSSTRHVRRLIERGELPIIRIGKLVRITPDDLARFVASCRKS